MKKTLPYLTPPPIIGLNKQFRSGPSLTKINEAKKQNKKDRKLGCLKTFFRNRDTTGPGLQIRCFQIENDQI